MKVSELLKTLETIKAVYGDMEVRIDDTDGYGVLETVELLRTIAGTKEDSLVILG